MANDYLKLGDWNAICDVCGLKFKASMLRKRWDNLMVCEADYELRHPQDFLRVPKENTSPPWARPDRDQYVSANHILTEASDRLSTEDGLLITTEFG